MKRSSVLFLSVLAMAVAGSAMGLTISELQTDIDNADSGAIVYVTENLEYDEPLVISKAITLTSPEGVTNVITRAAEYKTGTFLVVNSSGGDVTLANLVVDGNKAAGKCDSNFIRLTAGKLTLSVGCELRNFHTTLAGGIKLSAPSVTPTRLVMEEGSVIRGFENDSYAVGVLVGDYGTFEMTGGLITGCAGHWKAATPVTGYDGAVYVYRGTFAPSGGSVVGNTSENSVAGVNCYAGNFNFKGSFVCTNNVGGFANDVCQSQASGLMPFRLSGDYTGWMTIRLNAAGGDTVEGGVTKSIWTEKANQPQRNGGLNITADKNPSLGLDFSTLNGGWYPTWRKYGATLVGRCNYLTYSDARTAACPGDTLMLHADVDIYSSQMLTNDLTICGATGQEAIRQAADQVCLFDVTNATFKLRDVVLDGMRQRYKNTTINPKRPGMLVAGPGGVIQLERGAVIRGGNAQVTGGAISLYGSGSKVVMFEGAVISNCTAWGDTVYGAVIRLGDGQSYDPKPLFEMRGGLITGCDDGSNIGTVPSYGGMIYIYGGKMDMTGGLITGNRSKWTCSSVLGYLGDLHLSGTATITNNFGLNPGVYMREPSMTRIYGEMRGLVDVSTPDQVKNGFPKVILEDGATGAWCCHAANASEELYGYQNEGKVYWDSPIGSVGGAKATRTDDLQLIVPKTLNLNPDSADRQRLPLVFAGEALKLSGSVKLDFDADALAKAEDFPILFFAPEEGGEFIGKWQFDVPVAKRGTWAASSRGSGCSVDYLHPGFVILIQ